MARSRDISKVLSSNTTLATDAEVAASYATKASQGLAKVIPSSVAVGSGTGSANTVGTVTFSGASSVSLNDVFSSTYTNYRILIECLGTSAAQLLWRLRVSNSDNSSSNYQWGGIQRTNNAGSIDANYSNPTGTSFEIMRVDNALGGGAVIDIYNPFTSIKTSMISVSSGENTSNQEFKWISGKLTVTTSYSGFTILPQSGTITGTVSVYGYTI